MKTLYLDCSMGAAGDMLTAALLELLPNPDDFIAELNGIGIDGVEIKKIETVKCGITGTQIHVFVHGEEEDEGPQRHHHHSDMHGIEHIVSHLRISDKVKKDVLAVYGIIARAESQVHGTPVTQIHFHELGTMDAVADITAVCMLLDTLAPDEIVVSPINTGSGRIKCAHGILPVPAPATAFILKDIPIYNNGVNGELCTPTGAALLKYFASRFGNMPVMRTHTIGCGMGKRDFESVNCLRAMLGETEDKSENLIELSCNLDDITAEETAFAMERLFEGGAREVYTIPAGMKKSRVGLILTAICCENDRDNILNLMFRYTTTIGVRERPIRRYAMYRREESVSTPYGEIRRKRSEGFGVSRTKYEYEDIAKIANIRNITLNEAREFAERSFYEQPSASK